MGAVPNKSTVQSQLSIKNKAIFDFVFTTMGHFGDISVSVVLARRGDTAKDASGLDLRFVCAILYPET
jgi:hypothetical protein